MQTSTSAGGVENIIFEPFFENDYLKNIMQVRKVNNKVSMLHSV